MTTNIFNPPLQPFTISEFQETINDFSEAFDKAESKTNYIQTVLNVTPIPSLNQLRYAGFHISKVLNTMEVVSTNEFKVDVSHLTSAYKHCLRAYYDTLDFAAITVTASFKEIEQQYHTLNLSISEFFPDYNKWRVEIDSVSEISSISEENELLETAKTKSSRQNYYEKLDKKIDAIKEIYRYLPMMTERLAIEARRLEEKAQKDEKQESLDNSTLSVAKSERNIALWAAVASNIIAFIAAVLAYLSLIKGN